VKRLLAYSSVEHMGILALAIGFGAPIAAAGALLHVLAHAAGKSNAFMGAGVLVRSFGTKELSKIRGAIDRLPWSGPLFLMSVFALSAMPPFGMFRSEFEIVAGGFASARHFWTAMLIVLVTMAFLGLTVSTTRVLYQPAPASARLAPVPAGSGDRTPESRTGPDADSDVSRRGEPSIWMVVPMIAGVIALLVLGVDPPGDLLGLLTRGAAELTGGR
jgi:hydrogenase-4 component F